MTAQAAKKRYLGAVKTYGVGFDQRTQVLWPQGAWQTSETPAKSVCQHREARGHEETGRVQILPTTLTEGKTFLFWRGGKGLGESNVIRFTVWKKFIWLLGKNGLKEVCVASRGRKTHSKSWTITAIKRHLDSRWWGRRWRDRTKWNVILDTHLILFLC